jgi:hypothetical protein
MPKTVRLFMSSSLLALNSGSVPMGGFGGGSDRSHRSSALEAEWLSSLLANPAPASRSDLLRRPSPRACHLFPVRVGSQPTLNPISETIYVRHFALMLIL